MSQRFKRLFTESIGQTASAPVSACNPRPWREYQDSLVQLYTVVAAVLIRKAARYLGQDGDIDSFIPPQPVGIDAVEKIVAAEAEANDIRRA